nr:leucine-rich repeat domain-containing protein [Clostridia bacterium]
MKKFLSLLLAAMMLLGCIPAMAEDTLVWKVNKSLGTLKLDTSSKAVGHVEIPAEVDGVAVMALDYMCFKSTYDITSITIPDTVRMFECNTLSDAANLTALTLPADLIIIKNGSLTNMPLLETLTVPASVSVVNGAFSNLPKMKSITFEGACPVFVKDSYYGMFANLPADCVIYVPDDQIDAYKAAFADREDVVARIQPSGKNAVVIDWTAPESDFRFDAATGTITGYTGTASRIDIPATIGGVAVKTIGKQAFLQKYSLMYVTIPEGVETIEKQAFHGCSLMTYVSFPTTLRTIGDSAFNTNNLVDVGWAEGLESIGSKAFYNCDICYATLPTTLRTIADSGFENAGFVDVTFGPNVEKVGEKGFAAKTIEAITYTGAAMPAFGADAFKGCKKDATLTLADGSPKELYDGFVTYLASAFPTCVVNEPATMEMPFPALDVMAGMPFFGDWHAVAGKDVMGDFTNDYPVVTATLNPDGTANVILDGVEMPSAWYVEAGYAFLAPVENGKADAAQTYCYANIDENGRLVIDLGYAAAICEQDGKVYAAPARPEQPWPELDLSNGKNFVGVWQTADGSVTLTLNEDGTATSVEPGEEPYALRWYADYGTAYVGEKMSETCKVTFDGAGSIVLDMGEQKVTLAPYAEPTVIEGADELLGEWLDDIGNKLTIVSDGTMTYTYASDGWVNEYKWNVTDGTAVVTEGNWAGCPITLENGILTITNGEGIFQLFSADGNLSAYYGEGESYEMPEAQPVGPEGEAYFGAWKGDMYGMEVILTLNQDGTCAMEMFGESELGVWSVVDGKASIMGDELYINGDGNLVMESMGVAFTKADNAASGDEMSDEEMLLALLEMMNQMEGEDNDEAGTDAEEDFYIGRKFDMTGAVISGINLSASQLNAGNDYVIFNADGSVELFMGDRFVETLGWTRGAMNIAGQDYEGFIVDYYGTIYNFGIAPYGLAFDYFGTVRMYEPEGGMPTKQSQAAAEPETSAESEAPAAMFNSYEDYMDIKFVAKTYTSFGTVQDASTLGAEYAVTFHANGTCEFVMAGMNTPGLTWGLQEVAMGLTKTEAFVINYYGMNYNCIPTGTGFDMDFYGTMNLHFVPAE